jgi:replicative DNA helicase
MSDLDPFGDIKTEADVVLFLCPRVRVNWSEKHNGKVNWDIIVAKNTGGPTATCEVDLIPNFCAFVDVM